MMGDLKIASLDSVSANALADFFATPSWNKSREQYATYLRQHDQGEILCLVAHVGGRVAGYVKIVWRPDYPPLRDEGIPEIQDLNVLEEFRRQGVTSRLLDVAETEVAKRTSRVGIGVGLHPGYNAAQRLYVLRGYVPDGLGVTYKDEFVREGQKVTFDDDLVLHFIKDLNHQELISRTRRVVDDH
jgi:GNAT superfamily N-acetyltransferase